MKIDGLKRFYGVLISIIIPFLVAGQNIQFEKPYFKNPPVSENTTCVYKDYRGFIWIGTQHGLMCYNGIDVKTYLHQSDDNSSLSNNNIKSIIECRDSNLWIGTEHGLNMFDLEKETFNTYLYNPADSSSLSHNIVVKLSLDNNGVLWVSTREGLNKVVKESKGYSFERYYPPQIISKSNKKEWNILTLFHDSHQEYWLGTWGGGLISFDPKTSSYKNYIYEPAGTISSPSGVIVDIAELNDSILILGSYYQGVLFFNRNSRTYSNPYQNTELVKLSQNNLRIVDLYKTNGDKLWTSIGGKINRLYCVDLQTGKITFERIQKFVNDEDEIKSKGLIREIFQDRDSIVWIANSSDVPEKYNPKKDVFSTFRTTLKYGKNEKQNDYIKQIVYHNNRLWISTFGDGLLVCEPGSGKVIKRILFDEWYEKSNFINSMYIQKRENRLWVGSIKGVYLVNTQNYRVENFLFSDATTGPVLRNDNIQQIIETPDHEIIISHLDGIEYIDPTAFKVIQKPPFHHPLSRIRYLYFNKQDNLVICGDEGVVFYNDDREINRYLKYDPQSQNGLVGNDARYIVESDTNLYWIGTTSGLTKYNYNEDSYTQYRDYPSLSNTIIYAIVPLDDWLWVLSGKGLSRFGMEHQNIRVFTEEDGLRFQGNFMQCLEDKKLYIADEKKYTSFNSIPQRFHKENSPFYFTSLQVNGTEVNVQEGGILKKSISHTRNIVLNHNHKRIRLRFALLNFTLPNKNSYKYTLENYDDEWHYLGNKNEIQFMNLPPGHFTLKVKAFNCDAMEQETPLILKIRMKPPWWRSIWAFAGYLLATGLLIYVLYKNRVNKIIFQKELELEKEKSHLQQEAHETKIRFFTNVSHEFRTPLTLLVAPMEKLTKAFKDKVIGQEFGYELNLINNNVKHLRTLTNQLLEFRKIQKNKIGISWEKTDITRLVLDICSNFELLAKSRDVRFIVDSENKVMTAYTDSQKLQQILYNLLSNAFKYTPVNGVVKVQLIPTTLEGKDGFMIIVSDSGKGISKKEQEKIFDRFHRVEQQKNNSMFFGTGVGLHLAKEYTTIMQGSIYVESKEGEGSSFWVFFPYLNMYQKSKMQPDDLPVHEKEYHVPLLYDDQFQKPSVVPDKNTDDGHEERHTLLIVEDHGSLRDYMKSELQLSYEVWVAANGQEGLEIAIKEVPDIVVSDLMMPLMDGVELCREIKSHPVTAHIPVVLLTAKSLVESRIKAYEMGADDYITKPFEMEVVKSRLKNLIENRKKLQNLFTSGIIKNADNLPQFSSMDKEFLVRAEKVLEAEFMKEDFSVEEFALKMNMSRSQFYKKFMAFLGISPSEYLKRFRLEKSLPLLRENHHYNLSEIAYRCGFKHPSHFSRSFKSHYKESPTDYSKRL